MVESFIINITAKGIAPLLSAGGVENGEYAFKTINLT